MMTKPFDFIREENSDLANDLNKLYEYASKNFEASQGMDENRCPLHPEAYYAWRGVVDHLEWYAEFWTEVLVRSMISSLESQIPDYEGKLTWDRLKEYVDHYKPYHLVLSSLKEIEEKRV